MTTARKKQIAQMSNDQRLDILKKAALSVAGHIQNYQDFKLKMIADREELWDIIDIDTTIITDAHEALENDLDRFISGDPRKVRVNRVGNPRVTGGLGTK